MATKTVQECALTGAEVTFTAATAGGDDFVNTGSEVLLVKNANASTARTVTVTAIGACSHGVLHNLGPVSCPAAGAVTQIGPFPKARFNNVTSGKVTWVYSSEADLTIAVVKVAKAVD